NPELKTWLAFAKQKVGEVVALKTLLTRPFDALAQEALSSSKAAAQARRTSPLIHNPAVQARLHAVTPQDSERQNVFATRIKQQQALLNLPLFPTTTIGSFPQTDHIRQTRR